MALYHHFSGRKVVQPRDAIQQGGFSTAAGTHHGNGFPSLNLNLDTAQGLDPDGAGIVHLPYLFGLQSRAHRSAMAHSMINPPRLC